MNIYRVIITAQSSDCISALGTVPEWKRTGDSTFEIVREAYNADVAMRRAWSSFYYHGKVKNYWEKSNTEAIHAELVKNLPENHRRAPKVLTARRSTPNPDEANGVLVGNKDRTVQAIQPSVPELRTNRTLRIRFEKEYEEKFNQWQEMNGHESQGTAATEIHKSETNGERP
jgi:hypothetical protein